MESFTSNENKKVSDLFFLIMALNHLREWIAPNYKKNKSWPIPKNDAEKFSQEVYELDEFTILRELCNGTKHFAKSKKKLL